MIPYLVQAARMEPTPYTPVWLMRQAGRYLKEYRELRERYSFIELCKNKELIVEISLLPLKKFSLDGVIVFSDLLLALEALGLKIVYPEEGGPKVINPINSPEDVEKLSDFKAYETLAPLTEAIRILKKEIPPQVALIGFVGAPFTLCCYAVEGKGSEGFLKTKRLMRESEEVFDKLMERLTQVSKLFLEEQVKAGCDLIQVFDTWVGVLGPLDYAKKVLPYMKKLVEGNEDVPIIHFSTSTSGFLELISQVGEVIGVDWRIDIGKAWERIGYSKAIQGNLDPSVLLASKEVIKEHVKGILNSVKQRAGHIFNLGHGILPHTPEENVGFLVDLVHSLTGG